MYQKRYVSVETKDNFGFCPVVQYRQDGKSVCLIPRQKTNAGFFLGSKASRYFPKLVSWLSPTFPSAPVVTLDASDHSTGREARVQKRPEVL